MVHSLLNNTWEFAGFKTQAQAETISLLLADDNGKPRSLADFKKEAQKVGTIYNQQWLSVEYQHAIAASQSASKWVDIQANKKALPLLQYDTAGDNRVRASHATLDGITLAIDHPFWQSRYPPWEWACRCTVRQLAGGSITPEGKVNQQQEIAGPSRFKNIGITGKAFPEDMPFFKVSDVVKNALNNILTKIQQENVSSIGYDILKKQGFTDVKPYNTKTNTYYVTHPKHGELEPHEQLFFDAQFKHGKSIALLINDKVPGNRYADALIDGVRMELKSYLKTTSYDNMISQDFKQKKNQSANLILHFTQDNFKWEDIFRRVKGSTKANKSVNSVSIAHKKGVMITYGRDAILSDDFTKQTIVKAKELLKK
jgi:hypothetical protein